MVAQLYNYGQTPCFIFIMFGVFSLILMNVSLTERCRLYKYMVFPVWSFNMAGGYITESAVLARRLVWFSWFLSWMVLILMPNEWKKERQINKVKKILFHVAVHPRKLHRINNNYFLNYFPFKMVNFYTLRFKIQKCAR